jgi:hypothetical protein
MTRDLRAGLAVNFCTGTQEIKVKLRNFGTNTVNNVTVNWSFDNVPQTPIAYNTPIPTLTEVDLTLGTRTFASGISYPLAVWTSQPNNVADSFMQNDTLRANLKAAVSGTYTIGGATPKLRDLRRGCRGSGCERHLWSGGLQRAQRDLFHEHRSSEYSRRLGGQYGDIPVRNRATRRM